MEIETPFGANRNGHLRFAGSPGVEDALPALAVAAARLHDIFILGLPAHYSALRISGGFDILILPHIHDKGAAFVQCEAFDFLLYFDSTLGGR